MLAVVYSDDVIVIIIVVSDVTLEFLIGHWSNVIGGGVWPLFGGL